VIDLRGNVMPALVAGIHVFKSKRDRRRGWPGQAWTSPAMTKTVSKLAGEVLAQYAFRLRALFG
jgi:hypothetical protein